MKNTVRYLSQMLIPGIGADGQAKIATAKVLVIGAGGLGCTVLTCLAAMGIGCIGIVDGDLVELKNLHRQPLYSEADIGKLKVEVALQKLLAQNSEINITANPVWFTKKNAALLIAAYDIIVDCCDNAQTRYIIDQHTKALGKPFVYGAVRQMEGQLSVFNYKNGPSYKHLFPDEATAAAELDCATAGIIGHVTTMVGSLQVNEVVKIILGDDEHVLIGEVLTIDMQGLQFRKFKIKVY
jgi:adenylyltransferase/sulfurtransferase